MDAVLATKNRNKIKEIKKILGVMDTASRIYTLDDFPAFADIIIAKATGMTAIADDSGLEVDALNGAPGIYSARFAGENADDVANNEKLLEEMKNVPDDKRTARFVCCIALASSEEVKTFTGYAEGKIGREPRGETGFGYDPLFYLKGYDKTFAEISGDKKNSISHRAMALRELQKYLLEKRGYIRGF
jgi:XTP/dITP diphosphohydrolase